MDMLRIPERIALQMRREIAVKYKAGDRLPTVLQLAERFDVSKHSVTCALDILAREGRIEKWQGSGVYVTDLPERRHVAVVLDMDVAQPDGPLFWRQAAQHVRSGLRACGHRTRLYTRHRQPSEEAAHPHADLVEDVLDDRVTGAVVVCGRISAEWGQPLMARERPVVGPRGGESPSVEYHDGDMVREGARRLLAKGCRTVAFLAWGSDDHDAADPHPLLPVLAAELARHGARLDERWVQSAVRPALPGAGGDAFRRIWSAVPGERPDGVLVTDEMLFRGMMAAVTELGISLPDQIKVVTHGTKGGVSRDRFPVDVAEADPAELAREMVRLLEQQRRGEPIEQPHVVLPFDWHEAAAAPQT